MLIPQGDQQALLRRPALFRLANLSAARLGKVARRNRVPLSLAVVYTALVVVLTWLLFGPDGTFTPVWHFTGLLAYGNAFLQGPYGPLSAKILMVIVLAGPAMLGAVTRSLNMTWIGPASMLLADLVLQSAGWLVAGNEVLLFSIEGAWFFLAVLVMPSFLAGAFGALAGMGIVGLWRKLGGG